MYQSNTNEFSKNDFVDLVKKFEKHVTGFRLSKDNSIWDIKQEYIINHACLWNRINKIGTTCKIIQKNNKLALVKFIPEDKKYSDIIGEDNILNHLYRLEDLTKTI
jgi:hypothetical protein